MKRKGIKSKSRKRDVGEVEEGATEQVEKTRNKEETEKTR
jgi:hypothetical protein